MKNLFTLLIVSVLFTTQIFSQETTPVSNDSLLKYLTDLRKELQELKKSKPKNLPHFNYKAGLGFATPDSSYSVNIRFRIQNRFLMNTKDEDKELINPDKSNEYLLTTQNVASRWQVSTKTISRLRERGALKSIKIGNQIRISRKSISDYEQDNIGFLK